MSTKNYGIVFPEKEKAELRESPLQDPKPGEVRVRSTFTLISTGTETTCFGKRFEEGTRWAVWVQYPFDPGYSHVGVVDAVGSGVTEFKVGDRVCSAAHHALYIYGQPSKFLPVPKEVSDRDAGWHTLSQIVQSSVRRAQHVMGEDVVIIGLGPLGQLAAQFVNLHGPRNIILIDPVQSRLQLAQMQIPARALAIGVDQAAAAVKDLTNGRMADVVYDVTGNAKVFEVAQGLLKGMGKLMLLGDTGTPSGQHLTHAVIRQSLTIIGSHSSNHPAADTSWNHWTRANIIALFFDYLIQGRMKVSHLNTHVFSPQNPQEVYMQLLNNRGGTLGCHFDWTKM